MLMSNAMLMSIQVLPSQLQGEINEIEIELIVSRLANATLQPIMFYGMKDDA